MRNLTKSAAVEREPVVIWRFALREIRILAARRRPSPPALAVSLRAGCLRRCRRASRHGKYTRWFYPSQMRVRRRSRTGAASTGEQPSSRCLPDPAVHGPALRHLALRSLLPGLQGQRPACAGTTAQVVSKTVGGPDPGFTAGYAQTPGRQDYLYYDGHDGYDYGLYYEPVAAAAPGRGDARGLARVLLPYLLQRADDRDRPRQRPAYLLRPPVADQRAQGPVRVSGPGDRDLRHDRDRDRPAPALRRLLRQRQRARSTRTDGRGSAPIRTARTSATCGCHGSPRYAPVPMPQRQRLGGPRPGRSQRRSTSRGRAPARATRFNVYYVRPGRHDGHVDRPDRRRLGRVPRQARPDATGSGPRSRPTSAGPTPARRRRSPCRWSNHGQAT